MEELSQGLNLVQLLLFVALGLVAGVQWWCRRGAAAGWLTAAFGMLGVVAIASERFFPNARRLPPWSGRASWSLAAARHSRAS